MKTSDEYLRLGLRIVLMLCVLTLLGAGFYVLHKLLWSQGFLVWATNGYAMAEQGIWTGQDAMKAQAAHLFISFYGRTVASLIFASVWLASGYALVEWVCSKRQGAAPAAR